MLMMCIKEPLMYVCICVWYEEGNPVFVYDLKREPSICVWYVKEPMCLCMVCEGTPLFVYGM